MKIDIVIPSKNRACQLQLLLRSIDKYFENIGNIYIIFKATDEAFSKGYEKLIGTIPNLNITWIGETQFGENYMDVLNRMKSDYFLGISDDCVFLQDTIIPDDFQLAKDEAHLSLRLSTHNTYCQPGQFNVTPPEFSFLGGKFIRWNWATASHRYLGGDYAYPSSPDSNVWDRKYFIERIRQFPIGILRDVEIGLDNNRDLTKPYMLSFTEIKLISIAANTVWDSGWALPNMGITPESLNDRYLAGNQIKLPVVELPNACHIEYYYEYEVIE